MKDFIKIVDGYEEEIEQCKKDRKTMIKTNEDIIRYKKEEKVKMGERLSKLNYDLEIQDKQLNNINKMLNEYQEQNETYMDKLNSCELTHKERYEILEDKYKKVLAKYHFYVDKEMNKRKLELGYKDSNLCKEEEDLADLKLQDNLLKNVFLREIANEIKKQIKEIELFNQKYLEEQELLKFLGKVFYNKVKQRRAEMELTQESTIKNLCKSKSRKKFDSKSNSIKNFNNINIQINTGCVRDNIINSTKTSKSKNYTTTISS